MDLKCVSFWGGRVLQSKIMEMWLQEPESDPGSQNPQMSTTVKMQGGQWRKLIFLPLSSHYTRMWYLSYYFLMWNHRASSQQTAALLVSAVTSLTFSTSPQRLMDHSHPLRGHRPCPLQFSYNAFSQWHPCTSHIDIQLLRNGFTTREEDF